MTDKVQKIRNGVEKRLKGERFDGVTTVTSSSMGFTADPEWGGTNEYEF